MARGACVAREGVHGEGGHAWQKGGMHCEGGVHGKGGVHGEGGCVVKRGYVWLGGACMAGGAMGGGHALQERRPLQRAVRILLECILVLQLFHSCNISILYKF